LNQLEEPRFILLNEIQKLKINLMKSHAQEGNHTDRLLS